MIKSRCICLLAVCALLCALAGRPTPCAELSTNYQPMSSLNGGVFQHQCLTVNDAIYVITPGGFVCSAKIDGTGELSAWTYHTPYTRDGALPGKKKDSGFRAAAADDCLYVVSGDTTARARIGSNGSVSPWEAMPSLPQARSSGAMAVANGRLYYLGGYGQRSVFFCNIQPDGKLGSWAETKHLPSPRCNTQTLFYNGYLYVLGGNIFHENAAATIFRAKVNSDGTLERWTRTEPLPEARAGFAATLVKNRVYVFGGWLDKDVPQTSAAICSEIDTDGHFSAWQQLPAMPYEAVFPQVAGSREWLYLIGGRSTAPEGNNIWNTVWRYRINNQ